MKQMLLIIHCFEELFLSYSCHVHFFTILIRSVLNVAVQSLTYPFSPQLILSVLNLSVFSPQLLHLALNCSVLNLFLFDPQRIHLVLNLSVQSSNYPASPQLIRLVLNVSFQSST
jgi:hypothetical protein